MKTRSNNFDPRPQGQAHALAQPAVYAPLKSAALITAMLLSDGAWAAEASGVSNSYDWSVLIAAGFGLLGLFWIRRHVSRL